MITIRCRTNIDCAKHLQWPLSLPARPNVGDKIRSLNWTSKKQITMVVTDIEWVQRSPKEVEAHVYLEMPKHFATIKDFENYIKS